MHDQIEIVVENFRISNGNTWMVFMSPYAIVIEENKCGESRLERI